MEQLVLDFNLLKWKFYKTGKNWGTWEAQSGQWKCSVNARPKDSGWFYINDMANLITSVFDCRKTVEEAKAFCENWILERNRK
ncbi:MAG: hypothetical protein J6T16_05965 [Opitutales bacterium]|nr:hypothetical protein [Opitutales bacterium]